MKKAISLMLVTILLMTSLVGCKKQTAVSAKGPKTGPIGEWDIPIPEINPLGSQGLYTETRYETGLHKIQYIDNFAEYSKPIGSEIWTLEVKDDSGIPLTFLENYAKELDAHLFSSQYGDRLTFNYKKDEDSLWWGDAFLTDSGYSLKVVKETHVPLGKEVKFTPASLGEEVDSLSFVTSSLGERFQTATVTLPDGILNIKIESEYSTGIVNRNVYYVRDLSAQKTNTFIIDDLPQGKDSLAWTFSWDIDNAPSEFSVLLEELGEIPPVKLGDQMGALKVCGVPFGEVTVEPPEYVSIDHADGYSLLGDITPEGDTLFWLPAGYWNVVLTSRGVGFESSRTRFIPVSAGEETVLTFFPPSAKIRLCFLKWHLC